MAIWSIENIVETVRLHKAPYWKIYRSAVDRAAGNYVACADFGNPNLGLEESSNELRKALQRQTPGMYVMTAFKKGATETKNGTTTESKGGISTDIEIERNSFNSPASAVSGTGTPASAYVEGIGLVTMDNVGEVIEKKFALMKKAEDEATRVKKLEEENVKLKTEAREHETGINRGILSIGAMIWDNMRNTPTGKEVIGMFNKFEKYSREPKPKSPSPSGEGKGEADTFEEAEIVGGTEEIVSKQMEEAITELAKDNEKNIVSQLQMLVKLKKENPDLFAEAIENLKLVAGE